MTNAVSGDALTALLIDMMEIRSACGFMWMRMAVAADAQDAYDVAKREFQDHQEAFKRLETSLPELAALIAAGRSAATTEQWLCVCGNWHTSDSVNQTMHYRASAPAPLPAPTRWTGLMAGFAPADMDFSTTNSGDVGGPSELPRPR